MPRPQLSDDGPHEAASASTENPGIAEPPPSGWTAPRAVA